MGIFLSVVFYGMLTCVDYLGIILSELFFKDMSMEKTLTQMTIVILCKMVLFLVILVLNIFWKKKDGVMQMKNSEWILLLCFPVFTVIVMLLMLFSYQNGYYPMGNFIVLSGMVVMNIIMFALLSYISEKEQEFYQMKLLQGINKEKMQAFYEVGVTNEYQKRIMHDYGNQLNCIQGLLRDGQYEKAKQYAEKLTGSFYEGVKAIDVNNPVINVVLNQKFHIAEEKEIAMSFRVSDLSNLWMEDKDVVVLLSNLLDNAIEASDRSEGKRSIEVKIVLEKKQIILSIKNTVDGPVNIVNNSICTSKKDKNKHGIGLKNIQMVLDKYDGICMMRYEDGWFYYTAAIPDNYKL